MKIEVIIKEHGLRLSLDDLHSIEDSTKWGLLIYNILALFQNKEVSLVTISPQKYSIGLELDNHQRLKRNNREYLMNWNVILTDEILRLIAESEEFERGLLFLILSDSLKSVFDTIDAIDSVGSIYFDNLKVQTVILEDDGKTLILSYLSKEMENAVNQLVQSNT